MRVIATLGFLGRLNASGTVATVAALPFVYWLKQAIFDQHTYLACVGALFVVGMVVVHYTLLEMKRQDDPSEIVIDEVVGCLLAFWGIGFSASNMVVGFILFRFFDISKMAGVSYVERYGGAFGIMADDVLAALVSNLILRAIT